LGPYWFVLIDDGMDAEGRATQEPLPNKGAGIVVLFRAFVIEERAKTG